VTDGCAICAVHAGGEPLGGWLLDDDLWSVWILDGFEVPGWLTVGLRRHGVGMMSMDDAEATTFGTVLARVSTALKEATDAERVYITGLGELHPHWHVTLAARGADVPADSRGLRYFDHRDELLDPDAAVAVAHRVKELLRG
jgi:diadenosine tetraphosphate (Ap4A) HIT family hydrolase